MEVTIKPGAGGDGVRINFLVDGKNIIANFALNPEYLAQLERERPGDLRARMKTDRAAHRRAHIPSVLSRNSFRSSSVVVRTPGIRTRSFWNSAASPCRAPYDRSADTLRRSSGGRICRGPGSGVVHSLFDGSSSKGWAEVTGKPFPTHSWAIEDGCLEGSAPYRRLLEDIRTVDGLSLFELQFEWKLAKPGVSSEREVFSGIQRMDDWTNKERSRAARARGLEYQLVDLDLRPMRPDPTRITGALLFFCSRRLNANRRIAVFNESRLIVHDDHAGALAERRPRAQATIRRTLPFNPLCCK